MLEKSKKITKEIKELNKQSREILNQIKKTRDPLKLENLQKEFDALQEKVSTLLPLAFEEAESDCPALQKDELTQEQAQEVWDSIRATIRLAKFNDSGIELPEIDMAKIFQGSKTAKWQEVNSQIQKIIKIWKPD